MIIKAYLSLTHSLSQHTSLTHQYSSDGVIPMRQYTIPNNTSRITIHHPYLKSGGNVHVPYPPGNGECQLHCELECEPMVTVCVAYNEYTIM